jgi:hypothetical protein
MCLEQLYHVSEVTKVLHKENRFKTIQAEETEEIEEVRQVLDNAIEMMRDLLKIYTSGKVLKLKVKDAPLNLQLIPNVERIKLEKI